MRPQNVIVLGLVSMVLCTCGAPASPPKPALPVAIAGTITISEPRVRLPANGQTQTAAYLTLTNTGTQSDRLIGASSRDAGALELHAHTKTADGMMVMRELEFVEVPAGAAIGLVPGGLHIMVKQVTGKMEIGQTMAVELIFASGGLTPS